MTQNSLAAKVGVTQSAVWQWENGAAFPSATKIFSVAKSLDCDPEELINALDGKNKQGKAQGTDPQRAGD